MYLEINSTKTLKKFRNYGENGSGASRLGWCSKLALTQNKKPWKDTTFKDAEQEEHKDKHHENPV